MSGKCLCLPIEADQRRRWWVGEDAPRHAGADLGPMGPVVVIELRGTAEVDAVSDALVAITMTPARRATRPGPRTFAAYTLAGVVTAVLAASAIRLALAAPLPPACPEACIIRLAEGASR